MILTALAQALWPFGGMLEDPGAVAEGFFCNAFFLP